MKLTVLALTLLSLATISSSLAIPVEKPQRSMEEGGKKKYPEHWGNPPPAQTRDYVPLPGGYGMGSSTLKFWIQENMAEDAKKASSSSGTEETKWPDLDLVGMTGDEAKQHILEADPTLNVIVMPEDSMMTMDYRTDRVRVFVDEGGKVTRQPKVG